MRRILFDVGGLRIWSYPAMLYVGLVCGFYVMYAVAPSLGIERTAASVAALIMFLPAVAGARIWFVLDHWEIYRHDPRRIWRYSEGGMALYGGLLLALVLSVPVLAALGLGFAAFWDGATFTMLTGMIFTRVGCLLNGCCAGRPHDGRLGWRLPDHKGRWVRRYPVQLLEMAAAAALLAASVVLLWVGVPRGTIFLAALFGYAATRFAIDPLRERSAGVTVDHRRALAVFVTCAVALSALGWFVTTA